MTPPSSLFLLLGLSLAGTAAAAPLLGPPSEGRPDLHIPGLSLSRSVAHLGERVAATVVVVNRGDKAVKGVGLRFFLGGRPAAEDRRLSLAPGQRQVVRVEFVARPRGKQEFLVMVDPDNRVRERRENNNTARRTLGILSLPKALTHTDAPPPAAPEPALPRQAPRRKPRPAPPPGRPNLVAKVETIEGRHYFGPDGIHVKLRNAARRAAAPASAVGLRRARPGSPWLATVPAPPLPPGASVTLRLPWPGGEAEGDYVVVADIRDQVDEGAGGEKDNRSNLFRPVPVTAPALQVFTLTAPPAGTPYRGGQALRLRWRGARGLGENLQVLLRGEGRSETLVATAPARDDGVTLTLPPLSPGAYHLVVKTAAGRVLAEAGPYPLRGAAAERPAPAGAARVTLPAAGTLVRAGKPLSLRWQPAIAGPLAARLVDADTGQVVALDGRLDGAAGEATLKLPREAALFGNYRLELLDPAGGVAAAGEVFEILPPSVYGRGDQADEEASVRVSVDLAVTAVGFQNGRYRFKVANLGPDTIPAYVAPAVRLRTYFVRRVPVRGEKDYEVCERRFYLPFKPRAEHEFELGRDPDCAFGNLTEEERFLFAVTRVEIPAIHDAVVVDRDFRNNSRKLVYPESP